MQRYVVAYDIPSNKRRVKIGEILEVYGKRVNYSVFEIEVQTKAQKKILESKLLKIVKPKEDSLRFYNICEDCAKKSWSLGEENAPFERDAVYYF
ncbi:CRISPR-associated protein Cas2 [hydrothermal vent metagenome]|uniref:CRISPR-associated protein Cas2 n=1 Tax=hydrothermal vent metagenome TaxID=652676 RepID=A0A1W1BCV0_9ZZZZ